jgi:hypothetical protein
MESLDRSASARMVSDSPTGLIRTRTGQVEVSDGSWSSTVVKRRNTGKYLACGFLAPTAREQHNAAEPGTDVVLRPVIVLDGREIKDDAAGFSEPVFSPDSQRIAYMARVYKKGFMVPTPAATYDFTVVDGKSGPFYDRTSIPVFSPDSRRFAYYGVRQDI